MLLVVSDISEVLRTGINIASILYFGYSFFSKHQLYIKKYPKLPFELWIFLILYFTSLGLSALFSVNISNSITQILRVAAFFLIIYFIYAEVETFESIKYLLITIVVAGTITSVIILYNQFSSVIQVFDMSSNILNRTRGIYSNVNAMGGLFIVSFMILISLLVFNYAERYKKIIILFLIVNSAGVLVNNSRSAILGIIAGLLVIFYSVKRKYFFIFISSSVAVILLFTLSEQLMNILNFYFRVERTISGRDYFWGMAVEMFFDNWFLGIGPGGYKYQMYNYLPVMLGSWDESIINHYFLVTDYGLQHNFYLFILSELGIVGLFVISYFFLLIFQEDIYLLRQFQS
jgi:O-antigen ligase